MGAAAALSCVEVIRRSINLDRPWSKMSDKSIAGLGLPAGSLQGGGGCSFDSWAQWGPENS